MPFLNEHFARVRRTLLDKGDEAKLAQHAGIMGTARELIVSEFLRAAFPSTCNFMTGEIIDTHDGRSGQVDIIIVPAFAPRFVLAGHSGIALAEGTIAAIEVKSTLTTSSPDSESALSSALSTVRKIKERQVECEPWPWVANKGGSIVSLSSIPASIIAFKGPPHSNLENALATFSDRFGVDSLPNTITVLEQDYTLIRNDDWYFSKKGKEPSQKLYVAMPDTGACLADVFNYLMMCVQSWTFCSPFTPLSSYLSPVPTPRSERRNI